MFSDFILGGGGFIMKKKFLCLALCLLMIVASFAGCEEKGRDEVMNDMGEETSVGAVTLNMYLLAESEVSPEQELLVENAVNDIVNAHKIRLDLKYLTADKYYSVIDANLERMKTYYANKEHLSKETEAPVYTDENGLPATYYPPNEEFQVDIFYFSGYDRYLKYSKAGYLANFNETLVSSASTLKGNISSILYENVKNVNGQYDMMPINKEVGEYTYMLVNKDVLAKSQYRASDIASPVSENCRDLLNMVDTYFKDYVPFYSSEGILALDDVKFFGLDNNGFATEDFSLLAGTYDSAWNKGAQNAYPELGALNATKDNGKGTAIDQIKILKDYEFNGYYAEENEADKPFAVGYVKGGLEVLDKYGEDYEITVISKPTLTTEALYNGVLAISKQTKSLSQSAKILSELYTNEELINLLAHGVEGENYVWKNSDVLDENDNPYRVIEKQDKDPRYIYNMDPNKIGNTAMVYPTVNDDPTRAQKILDQNADAKADLLLGFSFYGSGASLTGVPKLNEYSAEALKLITEAKNAEELDTAIAAIGAMMENAEVKAALEDVDGSLAKVYNKWLTDSKIIVVETPA